MKLAALSIRATVTLAPAQAKSVGVPTRTKLLAGPTGSCELSSGRVRLTETDNPATLTP